MKAVVDHNIFMSFPDPDESLDRESFMYWIHKRPAFAQAHAGRQLSVFTRLKQLMEIESVIEFFGGVGLGTGIVQKLFQPKIHRVYEIASECLSHLQEQSFSSRIMVSYGDAGKTMLEADYADLMFCDFPLMNPMRLENWRAQLSHVFGLSPKAIYMNDTSFWSRHLHRERYARPLGKRVLNSDEEYILAYSEKMHSEYGYSIEASAIHHGASFLYVKSKEVLTPTIKRIQKRDAREAMNIWGR